MNQRHLIKFLFVSQQGLDVITEMSPDEFEKKWDDYWAPRSEFEEHPCPDGMLRLACVDKNGTPVTVRVAPSRVECFVLLPML